MCQTSLTTTKPPTATEALVSLTAISQRGAIQRLLLAIAVVLVPVCSNLPCCCKRAAASEASCCKKSETTASCCQSKSPKASKAVSSCCDIKKSSSTERSTGSSFKLPSCECCVQATTPEPVITVVPRSADKPKHSSLVAAIQGPPLEAFASLQITAGKNSPEFPPGKHNRQQAMLCVWRN